MSGDELMNDDECINEEIEEDSPEAFEKAKDRLRHRCDVAKIKTEEELRFDEGTKPLSIQMSAGREHSRLRIVNTQEANALLSVNFEKYCMLGEYAGICSYDDGTIEASIQSARSGYPSFLLSRRLLWYMSKDGKNKKQPKAIVLEQPKQEKPIIITIGKPSKSLEAFSQVCLWNTHLSLLITNSNIQTHDKALRLLERLANSLFFQIELKLHTPMVLQRERRLRTPVRQKMGSRDDLNFPSREYDPQPMSLYWYAKSATGMPLLQFLAYHQVLEFYMPTYSKHEAIGKVKHILKDPRFNLDKDLQVARILTSLQPSSRGLGDEKSQLEAVLRGCLDAEELRDFYTAEDARREFYESDFKDIALEKIPIRNKSSDLLTETAHRLYEIRCRIVHTKNLSDRDLPPLLPYSKEASKLFFDIDLIEYIATSLLVVSNAAIKLE